MLRRILFFAALSTMTLGSQAKVRLPHIIGDNMILQQDSKARLWSWDTPGKGVKVNVSWSKETFSAKTDNNGKWILEVQTPKASYTPLSITFNDGDKTTISNVLSGEVWVCAGQSNMEMPVKGFGNCPVEGYNKAVMNANEYKGIHYVNIPIVTGKQIGRAHV